MSDKRTGKRVKTVRASVDVVDQSLSSVFERFMYVKQAEGRSKATLGQHRDCFRYFLEFLGEDRANIDVREIGAELLREYVVHMMNGKVRWAGHEFKPDDVKTVGLKPATINTRLKTLRVFFGWLASEGILPTNTMQKVKQVREPEEKVEVLTPEQLKCLLSVPSQRTYAGFRDYGIMTLLLDSMIRINELVNLKVDDFDPQSSTITVRGATAKTRKARVVPITRETCRLLQELIEDSKEFNSEYIFLANYGERLDAGHVRHRLSQFGKEAGIPFSVHPHLFRHTGATLFLENGGSVRYLQMILGHSTLRLITRYTHPSERALKENHDRYSPLNSVLAMQNRRRLTLRRAE